MKQKIVKKEILGNKKKIKFLIIKKKIIKKNIIKKK